MIIQNAVIILENYPEITYLVSSHRHDFRTYTFKDGSTISVDGGNEYIRRVGIRDHRWEDYCLADTEPFYYIKNKLLWGTRGKDGKQPLKWVRFVECTIEHLRAILKYQFIVGKELSLIQKKVILDILADREEDNEVDSDKKKDQVYIYESNRPNPPEQVYIHKSNRPKYNYINPKLCFDPNVDTIDAPDSYRDSDDHKNSRIRWNNVTCPKCLNLKKSP